MYGRLEPLDSARDKPVETACLELVETASDVSQGFLMFQQDGHHHRLERGGSGRIRCLGSVLPGMLKETIEGLAVTAPQRPTKLSPGLALVMEGLDDTHDGSTHDSPTRLTAGDSAELTLRGSTHDSPQEYSELIGRQDLGPVRKRLLVPHNEALP